jgi:hypothetical protein
MIQFDNAVERYGKIILTELKESGINCWLAGGALRDYFAGIVIKTDYDLFFPNDDEYQKCAKFFKDKEAIVIWESDNGMKVKYNKRKFDLVKKFFPGPQETINEFDFTVSQFAVDTEKVYYGETSFIDLAKRQLMINKITFPASTMSRCFRYYTKGYVMCQGEMKKLFEAIQDTPKEVPDINPNDQNDQEEVSSGELAAFFTGFD